MSADPRTEDRLAELATRPLPMDRPLWQFHLVEEFDGAMTGARLARGITQLTSFPPGTCAAAPRVGAPCGPTWARPGVLGTIV